MNSAWLCEAAGFIAACIASEPAGMHVSSVLRGYLFSYSINID